jgi:hypothetical protein
LAVVFRSELVPEIDSAFTGTPQLPKFFADTNVVRAIATAITKGTSRPTFGSRCPGLKALEVFVDMIMFNSFV